MAFDEQLFWHRTAEANRVLTNAARRIKRKAARGLSSYNIKDTGDLAAHLGTSTRRSDGLITSIGLRTYRYGIIREYGAGRGWPGGKRATPNSQKPRTPAPWLSTPFKEETPKIANELAAIKGDDLVDEVDKQFRSTLKNKYRIS